MLNEVEAEHSFTPEQYTLVYDQVVLGIRKYAPSGSANMQFVGGALISMTDHAFGAYFLNASHHLPGIPIDWMR